MSTSIRRAFDPGIRAAHVEWPHGLDRGRPTTQRRKAEGARHFGVFQGQRQASGLFENASIDVIEEDGGGASVHLRKPRKGK